MTHVICIDTEYDARYTDLGVARLACMSYSLRPNHAAIAGPAEAVALWSEWVNDDSVTLLGHSLYNDVAVLAQETYRRTTGRDCVPGFDWSWELAHRLYEHNRVIDTEINQRLTHIRFGPHKASVQLGALAKMYFGEDKSDAKDVPDEVRTLLNDAIPYTDWPADMLARAPHRVLFGHYLERYGETLSNWPADAIAYALDDVRLPWRLWDWQRRRWNGREIPDARAQTQHSWMLHLVSIPGWLADRPRAAAIRERYRDVIAHCDRTLIDCGILHAPGRKLTAKRGRLQGLIADAFAGEPPLTKSLTKAATPEQLAALTPIERRDAAATDAKTVKKAIERAGGPVLTLDQALAAEDPRVLCTATGASTLNAHRLYVEARAAAKGSAEYDDESRAARCDALAEALLPLLTEAGLIEVSHPRTIKQARVRDYVYAILGDEAPLSKTAAESIPDPTPEERREHCSTAAKTIRQAILHTESKPLNVTDAVEKAEGDDAAERFDAWLADSGQPELNAYAVRSKADKTITNFLDRLDTDRRIRTNYVTTVDTGRTSSRGGGVVGQLNVQQLPRDYDKPAHLHVRGCILPDPGWAFIVADYSQLELCALAHVLTQLVRFYASDPKRKAYAERILGFAISEHYESSLSRAINNDQDCHVLMASVLRGYGETYADCHELYERADKKKAAKEPLTADEKQIIDDRQLSKPINFGYPGGLGERKFIDYAAGYGMTITLATAKRTKIAYMLAWPEMRLYFDHIGRMTADGDAVVTQFYSKRERGGCYFTRTCNCLDEETEALTRDRGWVRGFDLQDGDVILAKDPETGVLRWERALVKKWHDYAGELHKFRTASMELVSTPEHRWLVYDKRRKINVEKRTYEISNHGDHQIHLTGLTPKRSKQRYGVDFCALAGWFLTDGGAEGKNAIVLYQTKNHRKVEIRALLDRMGLSYRETSSPKRAPASVFNVHVSDTTKLLRSLFSDRVLTLDFLAALTHDELRSLYEAMMSGDGSRSKCQSFCAVTEHRRDMFQVLCTLLGIATKARIQRGQTRVLNGRTVTSQDCWIVEIKKRDKAEINKGQREITQVKNAKVWCPVVPSTFFVARRKGFVFITGNTYFQGLAADGAKRAGQLLVKHAYRVPESPMFGTRPSGFVHDEYLVNARREQAPLALPEVERLMVAGMREFIPDVKIKAPGKVLTERWGK